MISFMLSLQNWRQSRSKGSIWRKFADTKTAITLQQSGKKTVYESCYQCTKDGFVASDGTPSSGGKGLHVKAYSQMSMTIITIVRSIYT